MRNLRFASLALVALVMSALLAACSGPGPSDLNPGATDGTFALQVQVNGPGLVVIDDLDFECADDCTARIGEGVTVELMAQAQGDRGFAGWQGACSGTGTCTVTMDGDKTVTAVFADNVLMLDLQGDGQGNVRIEPGEDCSSDCVRAFDTPVQVSLLIDPADNSVAGGFGGACSSSEQDNYCLVTIQGRVDVSAVINQQRFTLAVDVSGGGRVTGSGIACPGDCSQAVTAGTSVTLTADPNDGWEFVRWEGGGCGSSTSCTVQVNGNEEVTAVFRERFLLATTVVGRGVVRTSPGGIECGGECEQDFPAGTDVTLTADPDQGWTFAGWSGACTGTNPTCSVDMAGDRSVRATFVEAAPPPPPDRTLTVRKDGDGTGTITGSGINCGSDCTETYDDGETVVLTATPTGDSTFGGWSGPCDPIDADSCEVDMIADRSVTATFVEAAPPPPPDRTLTVRTDGDGTGTITGQGIDCGSDCEETYDDGETVVLTATPSGDSTFGGWNGGGCSGTRDTCTVNMTTDRDVTAIFNAPQVPDRSLNVQTAGDGSGTITGQGIDCGSDCQETYTDGESVELTATPTGDSTFDGWNGDCSGTNNTCTVEMTTDRDVTATFNAPQVADRTLRVQTEGEGDGTITGEGIDCGSDCEETFADGESVELTATPTDDSTFEGWNGDCTGSGTTCTVRMDDDRRVSAAFSPLLATFRLDITISGSGSVDLEPAAGDTNGCDQTCAVNYDEGQEVVLTANPDAGNTATWSGACSGSDSCRLMMDSDKQAQVTFEPTSSEGEEPGDDLEESEG